MVPAEPEAKARLWGGGADGDDCAVCSVSGDNTSTRLFSFLLHTLLSLVKLLLTFDRTSPPLLLLLSMLEEGGDNDNNSCQCNPPLLLLLSMLEAGGDNDNMIANVIHHCYYCYRCSRQEEETMTI